MIFIYRIIQKGRGVCVAVTSGKRTARIASSNTILRPFRVSAEHSTYLTARIVLHSCLPCALVMGVWFRSLRLIIVFRSSRKSSFVPTRMIGTFGQWCFTSGYHWNKQRYYYPLRGQLKNILLTLWRTFSNEFGSTREKQMRKTFVSG